MNVTKVLDICVQNALHSSHSYKAGGNNNLNLKRIFYIKKKGRLNPEEYNNLHYISIETSETGVS